MSGTGRQQCGQSDTRSRWSKMASVFCVLLAGFLASVAGSSLNGSESDLFFSHNVTRELFALLPAFPTFSDNIPNERCRNDSRIFQEQLGHFKLWAVKMLDSSTKLPDGILEGNTFQMGHFDECLSVDVTLPGDERTLKGQYCLAEVQYSAQGGEAYPEEGSELNPFSAHAWAHIKSFSLDRTKTKRDEIYWALCIPSSCRASDLKMALEEALRARSGAVGVEVVVKVGEKFCQMKGEDGSALSWIGIPQLAMGSRKKQDPFLSYLGHPVIQKGAPGSSAFTARCSRLQDAESLFEPQIGGIWAVVGFFFFLVVLSTAFDILPIKSENRLKGGIAKFLDCFSATKNFRALRRVDKTKDIVAIHTMRFMSMIIILMGHRFIANSGAPMHNAIFMENAVGNPLFIHLLMGPVLVVDTFFLLSGFLTGNQMLRDFDTDRFRLIGGYVHRYIRLTPVYILVVGFYATILYHLGSGPLWKARVSLEEERCATNWWTNLLYVNNYVNTENLCMFQSWHLTCDFHFYLMAPPIVYLLRKKTALGLSLIGALIVVVVGFLFALTFINSLDPVLMSFNSVLVDLNSDPTFRITYIPTHTRFIPYLIGIAASYIYHKKKLHVQLSAKHQMWSNVSIFAVAHIPILAAIWFYRPGYEHDKIMAAVYAAFHRIPWCTAMAAMILLTTTRNGGLLQPVLSWKAFVPLSRLTYCVFLCHGAIQLYSSSSLRTPDYNSKFKILWTLMGDILISYLVSLVMHLLFEAPILRLDRTYFTSSHKSNSENPKTLPIDGADNKAFSSESVQNLPEISNDQPQFSVTEPHEKYSEKYMRRKSQEHSNGVAESR